MQAEIQNPKSKIQNWYGGMESPIGWLLVAVGERGVCRLAFQVDERRFVELLQRDGVGAARDQERVAAVLRELEEYFQGRRWRFDQPVDLTAQTPFQRQVLQAASAIPAGSVASYAELAERIGRPGAARAVGNALGQNPVPVLIPCHRVVRRGGALGGYTGGLDVKRYLLTLEAGAGRPS